MNIHGLVHMQRQMHHDGRGRFEELFRLSSWERDFGLSFACNQVSMSVSKQSVVRGMHCSAYWKVVNVVQGCVWDVAVDLRPESPTFRGMYFAELNAERGDFVIIPPGVAHGFCVLEDAIVIYAQSGEFGADSEIEFNIMDTELAIPWPISAADMIVSEKDRTSQSFAQLFPTLPTWVLSIPRQCDVLIVGSKGYIGQHFVKSAQAAKLTILTSDKRLNQREYYTALIRHCKPKAVVVCAGIAGKPNIDWCADNFCETMDVNLTGQLAMVEICRQADTHVTLILSGGIYQSSTPLSDDATPNNTTHVYTHLRAVEEDVLKSMLEAEKSSQVLGLRIHYPISSDGHPRSLLSKLLQFPKVNNVTTSLTVLDEVVPLALKMSLEGVTGLIHATNPDVVSYETILMEYQRVNPSAKVPPIISDSGYRSSCMLNPERLMEFAKMHDMPLHSAPHAIQLMIQQMQLNN